MTDELPENLKQIPEVQKAIVREQNRAFDCPHCGAYARQYEGTTYWFDGHKPKNNDKFGTGEVVTKSDDRVGAGEIVTNVNHMEKLSHIGVRKCEACKSYSIFVKNDLVYPKKAGGPAPHDEMPEKVKRDFVEARMVLDDSPRAAAALLRLAIQRLVGDELNADGGSLYQQIGNLVETDRISPRIQKALDSVRVIGNNSVHPGEMNMDDDQRTAEALFKLVNEIVDEAIAREKRIDEVYDDLPEGALEGIEHRDGE
jgi:hypothetical protein